MIRSILSLALIASVTASCQLGTTQSKISEFSTENDGEIALVNASPEKLEIISRFKVPIGTDQHWARLVIKDENLYLRHGNALMAYKISS